MTTRIIGAAIGIAYFIWLYSFGKRRGWMALIESLAIATCGAVGTTLMQP